MTNHTMTNHTDAPAVRASQPRRTRAAALLSTTAFLASAAPLAAAVLALTPAPMAAAIPVAAPARAHHASALLNGGDPCQTTVLSGAAGTFKLPSCAGD